MKNATYEVTIARNEERELRYLITRDVRGGICGPFSPAMPCEGMSLPMIEDELRRHGYERVGQWQPVNACDGLRLSARLEKVR